MGVLLQIKNAHKSYGDQVLLDGADATLTDDVKVGFVGRNGAGKSTLLRILLGEEELDSGEVIRHPQAAAGLFAAARPVFARRNGHRLPDARQRPARLEVRRSRRPVRAEGCLSRRPARQALGRLADPRQAGGPVAARAEPAAARRTDELPRPAHADPAGALSRGIITKPA